MTSAARGLCRIGWMVLLASVVFASPVLSIPDPPPLRLLDATGRPVAGARLFLAGDSEPVMTDANGEFHLARVPAVPFRITVFDEGGAWLGMILVERPPESSPELKLSAAAQEEVTVRSGVSVAGAPPPAAGVTSISRRRIEELLPARLADALQEVPGGGALEAGHTAVPSLRGLARGRTLLLLDGARVATERRAGASASYLDASGLEAVEIVRGPGSVAYGSDALGGVVHARTPSPRAGDPGGRFRLSAGSADRSIGGLVEGNLPIGSGAVLFQTHWRSFGDYDSPDGRVENSSSRDHGFLARGLLPVGRASVVLGAQFDRAREVERPSTDSGIVATSYPEEESDRFTVGIELPPAAGFSRIEVQGFLGRHRLVTERDRLASSTTSRSVSRADVEASDASLRVVSSRPLGRAALRLGVDMNGRFGLEARDASIGFDAAGREVSREESLSIESARRLDFGGFLEAEQSFLSNRLSLAAGLRGDVLSAKNSGGFFGDHSRSDEALSGYAATTVRGAAPWSVTLQYARGFRDPSLSDRYFRGVSGRGFVIGNPALEPESSDQYDLALQSDLGSSARVALYGYLYRIHDVIERYQESSNFTFRNRGLQELRGIEVEADVDLRPGWTARMTLSSVRGRIRNDGSAPDDVPPITATLSLQQRVSRFWWRFHLTAAGRDDRPGPTESETAGYGLVDLAAGVRFTRFLEAHVLLRNALDKEYRASPDATSVVAPRRDAVLALLGLF